MGEKMATLHIVQGFLGAGKTSFASELAEKVKGLHLDADEWCRKLYDAEEREIDWNRCFDETVERLWGKASDCLQNDIDVVLDLGFWNKASRDFAKMKAKNFNCGLKHYFLYAPDEVLKERLERKDSKIAEINLERFEELKKYFEEPGEDEEFIRIDNF